MATIVATAARLLGPLVVRSGIDDGITARDTSLITQSALIFLGLLVIQYLSQATAQFAVAWVG
jgi:ABC-type multidrug transport system fused ATPase/permease subunit